MKLTHTYRVSFTQEGSDIGILVDDVRLATMRRDHLKDLWTWEFVPNWKEVVADDFQFMLTGGFVRILAGVENLEIPE